MIATRRRLRLATVFVVALALITMIQPPSPANAANCVSADLRPTLREFMVTQGVGGSSGYTTLTRGKETLVKLFLTLPSSCSVLNGQYVKIRNASLGVDTGTAVNTLITSFASAPSLPATIQGYSVADPIFVVPSTNLTPLATDSFTPTFTASVTYDRSDGTPAGTQMGLTITLTACATGCSAPGKPFAPKTNALRVYVVPMGDKSKLFNTQYTATDQTIVQNAMQTLSRIYPTPAGVFDLTASSGGVRYVVDTATIVDLATILPSPFITINGVTKFCGTSVNFSAIKGLLAQYLLTHNKANRSATADRVVGVIGGNGAGAVPISFGTEDNAGCADGMASVSSAESWIRLIPDQTGKPSRSGSILTQEVSHTFALDQTASYHSSSIQADSPAGSAAPGNDRAYNVTSRSRTQYDHSVMNYNNTDSLWDDTSTLLEPGDFTYLLCQFAPATSTTCPAVGKIGTSTGVAAGEKYIIAGTTDGMPGVGHTTVIEPYYDLDVAPTDESANSLLRLVQLDTSTSPPTVISNFGMPWSPGVTHGGTTPSTVQTFYAAAQGFTDQGAGEVRLVKVATASGINNPLAGTTLFSSHQIAPPAITSITGAPIPTSGGTSTLFRTQITPRIPPKPDVVFLADTTGSMDGPLQNVKDNVVRIMNQIAGAQPNAQFAVSAYKDKENCPSDAYMFEIEQSMTGDRTAVQNAVNSWTVNTLNDGCDPPESQLNALYLLGVGNDGAAQPTAVGYRPGSSRVVVWFGDAPGHDPSGGHMIDGAIAALNANEVRAVAVSISGFNGSNLNSCGEPPICTVASGQATQIANATGGVVKNTTDASQVSDAILAGLHDLDATVTPFYNGDTCGPISIAFEPVQATVQPGGTPVDFTEHVTVAPTSAGTHTCRVFFEINGKIVQKDQGGVPVDDPAYFQDVSVVVGDQTQTIVTVKAAKSSDRPLLLDLIFECNSFNFVAAIAVPPSEQDATTATFTTNADTTNACAEFGGGGKLAPFVSDGWNRVGGTELTYPLSSPKAPTAAINNPAVGTAIGSNGMLSLRGSGQVAGIELLGSALEWSITTPGGTPLALSESHGNSLDVPAPTPNGWTAGSWTITLTVTYEGRTATATRTFFGGYQFLGFFSPVSNPPLVNKGTAGKTFALKWQLKSGSSVISDLSTVASTTYAPETNCTALPNAPFAKTSGQSILRFDQTNMQFVFNWQTPSTPGLYLFRLTLTDGSIHDACVNLSK